MEYRIMRKLLNKCQRVVLYASFNICRTVSTETMKVLHGELPWDLECMRKGILSPHRKGIDLE